MRWRKISQTKTKKEIVFEKFEGVDTRGGHKRPTGTSELVNFRVLEDGSLKKREGYRRISELDGELRAVWTGKIEGESRCYLLVGNAVMEMKSDGSLVKAAVAQTSEGDATFFFYQKRLYLIDGTDITYLSSGTLRSPTGYVPLVGKGWKDGEVGKINEPRNILSNKARYNYTIGSDVIGILYFDCKVGEINAVYVNGKEHSKNNYVLFTHGMSVSVSGLKSYDSVDVFVTYAQQDSRLASLKANTGATVFGGANNSRPFLWGNPNNKSVVYSSGYVSESQVFDSQIAFPESDALYFPAGREFSVGDGQYTVRAIGRHYDRMLIFTEGGAWMANDADCAATDVPVMNINTRVGVVSKNAVAEMGNQPCTVASDGIYRWNSDTDELNDFNAYSISEPINYKLPKSFFGEASVWANVSKKEFVFTYPNDEGSVWVYSVDSGAWSKFEGVYAERFFDFFGQAAFIRDKSVYVFDEAESTDIGETITATFESNLFDFDTSAPKRLSQIELSCDEGLLEVEIFLDGASRPRAVVILEDMGHKRHVRRMCTPRFAQARVRISAGGEQRQTIHSMKIKTR